MKVARAKLDLIRPDEVNMEQYEVRIAVVLSFSKPVPLNILFIFVCFCSLPKHQLAQSVPPFRLMGTFLKMENLAFAAILQMHFVEVDERLNNLIGMSLPEFENAKDVYLLYPLFAESHLFAAVICYGSSMLMHYQQTDLVFSVSTIQYHYMTSYLHAGRQWSYGSGSEKNC